MQVSFDGKGARFVAATLVNSVYRSYAYAYAYDKGRLRPERGGPLAKLAGWRVKIPSTSLGGPGYVLSRTKTDPVRGRIAVPTGNVSIALVSRNGEVGHLTAPKEYNQMEAFFANGRLLANVSNSRGPKTGDRRILEWIGGRWIDRGPSWIWGASASGRIVLIGDWETEKAEVVWVAKP
ncbi:hypothetical protein BH11ARM2_BH11ARM2_31610 [soil metagenome]